MGERAAWRGAKERHAYRRGCEGDVGGAPVLCVWQASEVVLLVVQAEHVAKIACCSLRVALEAKGEDDRRLASERSEVQLGRVDVGCDERVAVYRLSGWLTSPTRAKRAARIELIPSLARRTKNARSIPATHTSYTAHSRSRLSVALSTRTAQMLAPLKSLSSASLLIA